jgi:putative hydrolase of the HAD superfamily
VRDEAHGVCTDCYPTTGERLPPGPEVYAGTHLVPERIKPGALGGSGVRKDVPRTHRREERVETLNRRRIDVVFLDAGGVLLDPDWERGSAILARHGIAATSVRLRQAEARAKRLMDDAGFMHATGDITAEDGYLGWVMLASGLAFDPDALHAAARDFQEEHWRENLWSDMPAEVPPALARLTGAGLRLAVLSNTEANLRDRIAAAGLASFFEMLVLSAEVGAEKPDRAIFDEALRGMHVPPNRAVHVGDFYAIDVVGARGAGITPILLDRSGLFADRDCLRVRSLNELADLLGA